MSKPKFSFEKHQDTGSKLKAAHAVLSTLSTEIGNSYPVASKAYLLTAKAMKALGELRSELDSQLLRDCPSQTANDEWKGVYYGASAGK
jgi:hypothetical protein